EVDGNDYFLFINSTESPVRRSVSVTSWPFRWTSTLESTVTCETFPLESRNMSLREVLSTSVTVPWAWLQPDGKDFTLLSLDRVVVLPVVTPVLSSVVLSESPAANTVPALNNKLKPVNALHTYLFFMFMLTPPHE